MGDATNMIIALSGPLSAVPRGLFTKTPLGDRGTSGIVRHSLPLCGVPLPPPGELAAFRNSGGSLLVPTKVEHSGVDLNGREGWSPAFLTN